MIFDCHSLELEKILDFQVNHLQFKKFDFKYILLLLGCVSLAIVIR